VGPYAEFPATVAKRREIGRLLPDKLGCPTSFETGTDESDSHSRGAPFAN